jgi:hypothetical protein
MHITAPNARRVFGAREAGAYRITTSPMATRAAAAVYNPTGVAKYSRRTVVPPSGDTSPTMPTTMVKRATSNAADFTLLLEDGLTQANSLRPRHFIVD